MSTNTGGPAFPATARVAHITEQGMTLRDYFAAKAMQSMIIDPFNLQQFEVDDVSGFAGRALADDAYAMADHMMKARGE